MSDNTRSNEGVSDKWFVPGMACRDPETDVRWRLGDDGDWSPSDGVLGPWQTVAASYARASAAGPDLTDLATAVVYAAVNGWQTYPLPRIRDCPKLAATADLAGLARREGER